MDTDRMADIIRFTERIWENTRRFLVTDKDSPWHGGADPAFYIPIQDFLSTSVPLYGHPGSRYYRDPGMLESLEAQADYLLRHQWESGCITHGQCNVNSPPDTAFTVRLVVPCYLLLEREKDRLPETAPVRGKLRLFLDRAIPCMLTGGVHTPNHRWVMCGALGMMYELYGDERMKARAYEYLAEGFDITEQGEWFERSNGGYNPICGIFLYHAARAFGDDALLEPVRRNIKLMRYMIHPDGTMATEFSTRQDFGTEADLQQYYLTALLLAGKDRDPEFQEMAERCFADLCARGKIVKTGGEAMIYHMVYPDELRGIAERRPFPERYAIVLQPDHVVSVPKMKDASAVNADPSQSAVLRYRHGRLSVTAMAGRRMWLYVQYGEARMGMRLSVAWFGAASMQFPAIEDLGGGRYRLRAELAGSYHAPLPPELARDARGDYAKLPHHLRAKTHEVTLPVTLDLIPQGGDGLAIEADIGEPRWVNAQFICMFDPRGTLEAPDDRGETAKFAETVRAVSPFHAAQPAIFAESGTVRYRRGGDRIEISAPPSTHRMLSTRNDVHDPGFINVLLNYTTPIRHRIEIRCGSAT